MLAANHSQKASDRMAEAAEAACKLERRSTEGLDAGSCFKFISGSIQGFQKSVYFVAQEA
jgi:hypothetical protein